MAALESSTVVLKRRGEQDRWLVLKVRIRSCRKENKETKREGKRKKREKEKERREGAKGEEKKEREGEGEGEGKGKGGEGEGKGKGKGEGEGEGQEKKKYPRTFQDDASRIEARKTLLPTLQVPTDRPSITGHGGHSTHNVQKRHLNSPAFTGQLPRFTYERRLKRWCDDMSPPQNNNSQIRAMRR